MVFKLAAELFLFLRGQAVQFLEFILHLLPFSRWKLLHLMEPFLIKLAILRGQLFVFFVMTVAAAEVAVGLAIIVALFRNRETVSVDEINLMKW